MRARAAPETIMTTPGPIPERSVGPRGTRGRWVRRVLWAVWGLAVLLWSVALLTPQPVRAGREVLSEEALFSAGKCLHVGSYAALTAGGLLLAGRGRPAWLVLGFMSLHGAGTEYLQTFVPERHGCWQDVAIDHVGVGLGLATWVARVRWEKGTGG